MKDFFISFTKPDEEKAKWIAWQLEDAGYTTIIQTWDFRPGENFVLAMDRGLKQAAHLIAVLSPDYVNSVFTPPEWAEAFLRDPTGETSALIPVRIKEFELGGLLAAIVYIDLVGLDENAAKEALLEGVKHVRPKRKIAPRWQETKPTPRTSDTKLSELDGDLGDARSDSVEQSRGNSLLYAEDSNGGDDKFRSGTSKHHRVPASLAPFIGRKKIVSELVSTLREVGSRGGRLITLKGPAGVGKSRIANEVAEQLEAYLGEIVVFVPLKNVSSPSRLLPEIAKHLDVEAAARLERRTLIENVEAALSGRQVVLILDGFERFLSETKLVEELLQASPRLKVLVTSRKRLKITGERVTRVRPMKPPELQPLPSLKSLAKNEAVSLFIEYAILANEEFQMAKSNATTVVELCRLLDGLPLALELAAGHMGTYLPDAMLRVFKDHRQSLEEQSPGTEETSRLKLLEPALRNALDVSYDLLDSEQERRLFRRLSVFMGSFRAVAAMEICYTETIDEHTFLRQMEAIEDVSLLKEPIAAEGEQRFEMLAVIREYARELMQGNTEDNAIDLRARHARYYHAMAEQAYRNHRGKDHYKLYKQLAAERENFHSAFEYLSSSDELERIQMALEVAGNVYSFWTLGEPLTTARWWLQKLLEQSIFLGGIASRARALYADGRLAWLQGDHEAAWLRLEESISIWQSLGDEFDGDRAYAMITVASLQADENRISEALDTLGNSRSIFVRIGDRWGTALCNTDIGRILYGHGDRETARFLIEASLEMFRSLEDPWGVAISGTELGCLEYITGDHDSARAHLEEVLRIYRQNNDNLAVAYVLTHLGNTERYSGHYPEADRYYKESFCLWAEAANPHAMAVALLGLSYLEAASNQNWEPAAKLLGIAETLLNDCRGHLDENNTRECAEHKAVVISVMGEEEFKSAYNTGVRKAKDLGKNMTVLQFGDSII